MMFPENEPLDSPPIRYSNLDLDLVDVELDEPQRQTPCEAITNCCQFHPNARRTENFSLFRTIKIFALGTLGVSLILMAAITIPPLLHRNSMKTPLNSQRESIDHINQVIQFEEPSPIKPSNISYEGHLICGSSITSNTNDSQIYAFPSCFDVLLPEDHLGMKGNWYNFLGNGSCVTLSTCNPKTDFDTTIRVYTDTPMTLSEDFTCKAANDDTNDKCPLGQELSTVSFPTQFREFYYVLVGGFDHQMGTYTLSMECEECKI